MIVQNNKNPLQFIERGFLYYYQFTKKGQIQPFICLHLQ